MIKFYTVDEIAELLKVNKFTVYRWINEKRIVVTKFGASVRISEKDLEDFIERSRRE